MAKSFNATSVTFDSVVVGDLTNVDFGDTSNEIDVTVSDSTNHVFETGIPSITCSVTVLGNSTAIARGDVGALSVSWNDGSSDTISSALVTELATSGGIDAPIETTITFVPAAA